MEEEICEIPLHHVKDEAIEKVLKENKTVAVVGLSTSPKKDSHRVAAFLQKKGYRVIPVHPKAEEILGEKAYPSLLDIPEKVDIVNVFRPPSEVPGIMEQAIKIGAKAVWTQEGIVNNEAWEKGIKKGLAVIMDKCMMKEYKGHLGDE